MSSESIKNQSNSADMGFVYEIRNIINGRIYIGRTGHSIRKRWAQHIWHSHAGNFSNEMHQDIDLMGEDCFTVKQLYQSADDRMVEKAELYYIHKYQQRFGSGIYNKSQKLPILVTKGESSFNIVDLKRFLELHSMSYRAFAVAINTHIGREVINPKRARISVSEWIRGTYKMHPALEYVIEQFIKDTSPAKRYE